MRHRSQSLAYRQAFHVTAHVFARLQDQRWQRAVGAPEKPAAGLPSHFDSPQSQLTAAKRPLGAFIDGSLAASVTQKPTTATARKIAVLFYNAMRYGMDYRDPGADHYEQQYRDRVIKQLHRRAAQFGYALQPQESPTSTQSTLAGPANQPTTVSSRHSTVHSYAANA
jgi:hypothetical protein